MTRYLKLRPSVILSILLLFVYLFAILAIFALPLIVLMKFLFAACLLGLLAYYFCSDVWMMLSCSPVAIRLVGTSISVITRGEGEYTGEILGDSVVTPILTILHIFLPGHKILRYVIIFQDSMVREDFRELRVMLRWGS